MTQAIGRVRDQLRQLDIETDAQIAARGLGQATAAADRYAAEFDPLEMDRYTRMQELSRALNESVGDLANLQATMDELASEAETLLLQQGRVNTEVQQGLMRTLMVPFSRQVARLQRVVRQVAQENGRQAEAVFAGVESELDRNVLERMTAPLEHLLRNSVVHGIETPDERTRNGKMPLGKVAVTLWREDTQLFLEVRDDGRGLDFNAIRETAIKRGLMPSDAQVRDEEVAQFIFESGFSTAKKLTQDAGRGIGMDVVASEVKQLGGTLELGSEAGKGARFLIRLPLTLAMSQALLVGAGHEQYAIPLPSIEGIARIPREQLDDLYREDGPLYTYGAHQYRVRHLGSFIGIPRDTANEAKNVAAILVRMGEGLGATERRVAVVVDQMLGNREVVSKAVGPQVSSIPGVSGATILADGRVVLILDVAALTTERSRRALISLAHGKAEAAAAGEDQRDLIMVVDDSITIRRVTERLLGKHGFRVITAKDGLDAMAQLQTEAPRAILLDIEMPKADGFEVAAYVRNNTRIARTPIIMITSRSGDKHRERARAIGVNRYMIKPYQEDELLGEIRGVIKESA
jgi:chemosensory pili system protein ChpA (sensor histidine kinase/response regulator)